MTKLVKMAKDDGSTADVHPDEVDNYRAGGFNEVAPKKATKAVKKEQANGAL